ncbi:hypothetical protein SDC9_56680 [bioreactor metagenome]|uniref:Uncharacterized protein n=1 Tax=bioreactor metagenome TaxID=1076179 RepID=A0A644X2P4_9ZZZZ
MRIVASSDQIEHNNLHEFFVTHGLIRKMSDCPMRTQYNPVQLFISCIIQFLIVEAEDRICSGIFGKELVQNSIFEITGPLLLQSGRIFSEYREFVIVEQKCIFIPEIQ